MNKTTTSAKTTEHTTPTPQAKLDMEITRENFAKKIAKKMLGKVTRKNWNNNETHESSTKKTVERNNKVEDTDMTNNTRKHNNTMGSYPVTLMNNMGSNNKAQEPHTTSSIEMETTENRVMAMKTTATNLPATEETARSTSRMQDQEAVKDTTRVQDQDEMRNQAKTSTPETNLAHNIVITFVDNTDDKGVNKTYELVRARVEPKIAIDDIKEDLVVTFAPQTMTDENNNKIEETFDTLRRRDEGKNSNDPLETKAAVNSNNMIMSNGANHLLDAAKEEVGVNKSQHIETNNREVSTPNKLTDRKLKKYNNVITAIGKLKTFSKGLIGLDETLKKEDKGKLYKTKKSHVEKVRENYEKNTNVTTNSPEFTNIKSKEQIITPAQSTTENVYLKAKESETNEENIKEIVDIEEVLSTASVDVTLMTESSSQSKESRIKKSHPTRNSIEGNTTSVTTSSPTQTFNRSPVKRDISEHKTPETELEFPSSPPTIDTTKQMGTTQRSELNEVDTTQNHRAFFHLIQSDEITITKPIDLGTSRDIRPSEMSSFSDKTISGISTEIPSHVSFTSEGTSISTKGSKIQRPTSKNPTPTSRGIVETSQSMGISPVPTPKSSFPLRENPTKTPLQSSSQLTSTPDEVITPRALPSSENEESNLEDALLSSSQAGSAVLVRQERVKKTV